MKWLKEIFFFFFFGGGGGGGGATWRNSLIIGLSMQLDPTATVNEGKDLDDFTKEFDHLLTEDDALADEYLGFQRCHVGSYTPPPPLSHDTPVEIVGLRSSGYYLKCVCKMFRLATYMTELDEKHSK